MPTRVALVLALGIALARSMQAQTFQLLLAIPGDENGGTPYGILLLHDGKLYGTTFSGGVKNIDCLGLNGTCGTVFEWDLASGQETVLHTFLGSPSDGSNPYAGVVRDSAGDFYGATYSGGTDIDGNDGTVFRIDSAGAETVLHSFIGTDGENPWGAVALDFGGNLLGTTLRSSRGSENGNIFKLDNSNNFTRLHELPGPYGALHLNNYAYCTTIGGGASSAGTVFRVNIANGKMTILYSFTGGSDGGNPVAGLVGDGAGNLYGTTSCGGNGHCPNGNGVVFMLNAASRETVLHTFGSAPDGANPQAPLVRDSNGNLFGTTLGGGGALCNGGTTGCGTVFELTPPAAPGGLWTETVLHNFTGAVDGWLLLAGLALASDGHLFGVAASGGAYDTGTLFEITP